MISGVILLLVLQIIKMLLCRVLLAVASTVILLHLVLQVIRMLLGRVRLAVADVLIKLLKTLQLIVIILMLQPMLIQTTLKLLSSMNGLNKDFSYY